jgi:ankyrin repeat protein
MKRYTVFYIIYSTPLHSAIFCKNKPVFKVLLQEGKPNLELKNADGHTVLWLALQEVKLYW